MESVLNQESWTGVGNQAMQWAGGHLSTVLTALAVLVVGWLVALLIAAVVRIGLRKVRLNDHLGRWSGGGDESKPVEVERPVARGLFWLLMLFVLVAFFQVLGLTVVTQPLNQFLNRVFEYAPRIVGAGVLLLIAWVVARLLRFVVARVLTTTKLEQRLNEQAGVEADAQARPLTTTAAEAVYWLTFLLFLPAILDALAVPGLLGPVQEMLTAILGFLPNLLAAAVIFLVGWFVARVVQRIVSNLLAAVGTDRMSRQLGMTAVIGQTRLSSLLGLIVYVLILIPVLVAALGALKIDAVTQPASQMLNTMLGALPGIFAAVLVIGIAYVVGRIVAGLVTNVLRGVGFNRLPEALGIGRQPAEGERGLADFTGTLILVAIVLVAVMQALPMLGFDMAADMMGRFLVFAGHVLLGIVIFGLGLYLAKMVADGIRSADVNHANILAPAARVAILVLAGAMGLREMGLAEEIVNLAFGLALGAIAVAVALAFGFGGRDAAKHAVEEFVERRKMQPW